MNIGVISDIHANLPALKTTLAELETDNVDTIVCLGDIIGVLGNPNEVVNIIRNTCDVVIYGNHDTRIFPERQWMPTKEYEVLEHEQALNELTEDNYEWLTSLPNMASISETVTLAHARPDTEVAEGGLVYDDEGIRPHEYIEFGAEYFDNTSNREILLLGHTHDQHAVDIGKFQGQSHALILNPGSVGFPFDHTEEYTEDTTYGNASYAVVDTETLEYELCNIVYDSTTVTKHVSSLDVF